MEYFRNPHNRHRSMVSWDRLALLMPGRTKFELMAKHRSLADANRTPFTAEEVWGPQDSSVLVLITIYYVGRTQ
jgi:hypothetical protein